MNIATKFRLERAKRIFIVLFVAAATLLLVGTVLGVYRVNTGEAAIITPVNGQKYIQNDVGIHVVFPLISTVDKQSVVNRFIYYPSNYPELDEAFIADTQAGAIGIDINTKDDKVVDVGAYMSYQIVDLAQYGINNTNPEQQLQSTFDSIVRILLQSETSANVTGNANEVNARLLQAVKESGIEQQYGVRITEVKLLRNTYTQTALQALAEKQAIQAIAEGNLNAAKSNAEATIINTDAEKYRIDTLKGTTDAQLDYNAKIKLYEALDGNQNVIWVIPYDQPVVLNK